LTVADVGQDVDWTALENLVAGTTCANMTIFDIMDNSTDPNIIPQQYLPFIQ